MHKREFGIVVVVEDLLHVLHSSSQCLVALRLISAGNPSHFVFVTKTANS